MDDKMKVYKVNNVKILQHEYVQLQNYAQNKKDLKGARSNLLNIKVNYSVINKCCWL